MLKHWKEVDGYLRGDGVVVQPATTLDRTLLLSKPAPPRLRSIGPSRALFSVSHYEAQAFDFYIRQLSHGWRIITPSPEKGSDWVQLSLQLAVQEPVVFNAVAAIGLVNRDIIPMAHYTLANVTCPALPDAEEIAMRQYTIAIAGLQGYINNIAHQMDGIVTVSICCLLLVVYEVIQDNGIVALRHLRLGRKALRDGIHCSSTSAGKKSVGNKPILDGLLLILDALEGTSVDAGDHRMATLVDSFQAPEVHSSLPPSFACVEQAQGVLDNLLTSSCQLRAVFLRNAQREMVNPLYYSSVQAARLCASYSHSRKMPLSTELWRRKGELLEGHAAWSAALKRLTQLPTTEHHPRLLSMQIQRFFPEVVLKCYHVTRVRDYDRLEGSFISVMGKIEEYLVSPHLPDQSPPKVAVKKEHQRGAYQYDTWQSFSLGYELLPALNVIALKSGASKVRRKAVRILQTSHRRVGLHARQGVASFAEDIIRLEEERARIMLGEGFANAELKAEDIPEEARYVDVVKQYFPTGSVSFWYTRFRHETNGELEVIEYEQTQPQAVLPLPPGHLSWSMQRKNRLGDASRIRG